MPRQYWMEPLSWSTADGSAVANSTTETIIFPNITIPANYMQDGRLLKVIAYGRHSTTATPTLRFRLRWNGVAGTVLADSGTLTCGGTVTAAMWKTEIWLTTRANGASGSLFAAGEVILGEDAALTVGAATNLGAWGFMGSGGVATPAAVTVDLTADTPLSLTAQWGTASASNTLTGHNYYLIGLN